MKKEDYSLMYVTDDRITDDNSFFEILEAGLKGGVSIVQLREKSLDTRPFFLRAKRAKFICDKYGVPFIINDRIDIALAVEADGVHLGQKDMPVSEARKLLGKGKIIGLSVGDLEQAKESNTENVDYIGLSPIFSTSTKTKDLDPPLGIEGLKKIRTISQRPVVCIGGVNKSNTGEIIGCGADGVAVISAMSQASDPEKETRELKQIICPTGTKP